MKIKSIILSVLCVAMLALTVGCGCQSKTASNNGSSANSGNATFRGIVVDTDDSTITVKPYKQYEEYNTAEKITVSTDIDAANKPKKIEIGKSVQITYDGNLEAGNPGKISKVYSINFIDEKGNLVNN